jgi:predicted ATPase
VRGEHRLALALAEQLEQVGEARNDIAAQLVGRWANGRSLLFLGDFAGARDLLERCHGLADPAHRRGVSSADPYVMTLTYLAWTLALLGFLDQARARLGEALAEARRLNHPQTLADVLLSARPVEGLTGSPDMETHVAELMALSTERGFPLHLGWATAYRGVSLTALGDGQAALTQIRHAMVAIRTTGAVTGTPDLLRMIAGAHAILGQTNEGLDCLTEAEQIIEVTDERFGEAELHRLRGDLLTAAGNPSAAEASYHQAITVARRQSARPYELRASIRLARLWCTQDRRGEARDLLSSVYGAFTEGFDTPDLREAGGLLEELA